MLKPRTHVALGPPTIIRELLVILVIVAVVGCTGRREIRIAGRTMGTTYHVTVIGGYFTSVGSLRQAIDERLEAVNASMSTYRPESEISRFNALSTANTAFAVGKDFFAVMTVARQLYELTGGAWDGTIDPLVDLWGFGRSARPKAIPPAEAILAHMAHVGFGLIDIAPPGVLVKRDPKVTLDLASVAKGFGVDAVADLIRDRGFDNFLVEVGGEVFGGGARLDGRPWRIGINRPEARAPINRVYKVVALHDRAFATSGDYRLFFERDGRRFSHIIDPRTGYPVANGVVSVSVTAATCARADGLATALMVMGVEEGLALVDELADVECLLVVRDGEGNLVDHFSRGFSHFIVETES
jgi:thiamine biosynthesis lipoprotein